MDDRRLIAHASDFIAFVYVARQEYALARQPLQEALAIYQSLGDENRCGGTQAFIGDTYYLEGRLEEAQAFYEAGLRAFQSAGNDNYLTYATRRLGYVHLLLGDWEQSRAFFSESLELNLLLRERQGVASCLEAFANLAYYSGELERAARLYGAAANVLDAYHTSLILVDGYIWDQVLPQLRQSLGEEAFQRAWAVGYALSLNEAVAYAERQAGDSPSPY